MTKEYTQIFEPGGSRDEDLARLKVVIVGADILAYSYVREFNRAYGLDNFIVLASQDVKMLSESKFTDYRIHEDLYDEDKLPEILVEVAQEIQRDHPGSKILLLGCDDRHARLISYNKQRLQEAGFVVPYVDFKLLDFITQKHNFYDLCEELGIPYPKTWYFSCDEKDDVELTLDEFSYPLIAKPSNSAQFGFATIEGKRKIYEIESEEELLEVWKSLRESDYNNEILIQEFIPGPDDEIRTLTLFADKDGDTRVVMGGRVCLQDHNPTALGNPVVILGERTEEIIENAKKLIKHIGYHGFANFDIKKDPRDGSLRFFEVNTRCGRNTYQMSLGGVNFCTLFVKDFILNEEIPYREAYDPFVYSCVPEYVIKKSITDKDLLDETLSILKKTNHPYPLDYPPDSLKHKFWAEAMFLNQIPKFKRYYWDTNGAQLKP